LFFDSSMTYDGWLAYGGGVVAASRWVELDDLVFSGAADADGVEWLVEDLEGWDDGVDVRSATAPRPGQDGVWIGDAWYGARLLVMKGAAFAPSKAAVYAAKDLLIERVNLLRSSAVLTVNEDQVRRALVRRVDRPLVRVEGNDVIFSIALLAPDPRKYAVDESTLSVAEGGSDVAGNDGNVATLPAATIAGPVDTPTVSLGADDLTFDVALDAGETLSIDFDLHTATVDGTSVRSYLTSGYRWGSLPPGDTPVGFSADSGGAGGLELAWRSAWI
jgi:hypothetical protein